MLQTLANFFKAKTLPFTLPEVETLRCGQLRVGMYVIHMGNFAKVLNWSKEKAQIEYICYTAGTKEQGYDRSSAGANMWVGLDSFRAATTDEIEEYLYP